MRVEPGRRTFVRNLLVSAPALAGAAALSRTTYALPLGPAADGLGPHAGIDRVLRQLAGLHNDIIRRRPTAADVRTATGYLRELIAYRQETNRDAELARVFRGLIATHGRQRLLDAPPDRTLLVNGLAAYGVQRPALDIGMPPAESRAAVLDVLARQGAVPYYTDELAILEELEALVEDNNCEYLEEISRLLEAFLAVVCASAAFFPPLAVECFAGSMLLAVVKALELIQNC